VIYILDACAMIAFLRGEVGAEVVAEILRNPDDQCFAHAINLCEVYYDFFRASGEEVARAAVRDLEAVGIQIREEFSTAFWQAAGTTKAQHARISLADCFAITLARMLGGTVLTTDHREFDPVAALGICQVRFIR